MAELQPDMMAMIKQQQSQGQQPEEQGQQQGPGGGGMGTPQPKQGERMLAGVWVKIALKMMEKALPVLGSNSDEGKTLLEAMSKLSKTFGKNEDKSLVPSEIMQMKNAEPSLQGQGQQAPQQPQQGQPQGQPQ